MFTPKLKLVERILDQEKIINAMRKQYFQEVQTYRMATVTKPLTINRKKMPEPKVELIVKYFDESLGLEQNIRDMLNERIKEIETQARSMIMQNG